MPVFYGMMWWEKNSATRSKIIEDTILKLSQDAKEICVAYQDCQQVIYYDW